MQKYYVDHFNCVASIRHHHRDLRVARSEVARQLRDFRRLGLRAVVISPGTAWFIGVEVVQLCKPKQTVRRWPPSKDHVDSVMWSGYSVLAARREAKHAKRTRLATA
jgi:hypothetical protein